MIPIERDPPGRVRRTVWIGACALFLAPLVAMQFTHQVVWTANDFLVLGTMLLVALASYELAERNTRSAAYRWAAGITIVAAFFLVWADLAVGLIGSEDNPANLIYLGVLGVPVLGGLAARFRARPMAYVLLTTAIAQLSAGIVALLGNLGAEASGWPRDVTALTGIFIGLWLAAAFLFRRAAREEMAA